MFIFITWIFRLLTVHGLDTMKWFVCALSQIHLLVGYVLDISCCIYWMDHKATTRKTLLTAFLLWNRQSGN